ncbi:MAG: hypothetical protein KA953_08790 [Lachnospiraceae bacterium]|jgi:hypothetical protein|nr:hypothetical protein [Lachnospiraceae bacterium]
MKKILVVIGCIITVVMIGLLIAIPVSNNIVAKETAKTVVELPIPEKTEYKESISLAGKLVGNGNGMQYFGAILIKSELSLNQLSEYYKGYSNQTSKFTVENQKDQKVQVVEHKNLSFKTDIKTDNFYIVYTWGSNDGLFDELDIRGN